MRITDYVKHVGKNATTYMKNKAMVPVTAGIIGLAALAPAKNAEALPMYTGDAQTYEFRDGFTNGLMGSLTLDYNEDTGFLDMIIDNNLNDGMTNFRLSEQVPSEQQPVISGSYTLLPTAWNPYTTSNGGYGMSSLGNFADLLGNFHTSMPLDLSNLVNNSLGLEAYAGWRQNGSSIVNFDYNFQPVSANNPAPVPEPGTFVLLGSGLAGLAFCRRRMSKA